MVNPLPTVPHFITFHVRHLKYGEDHDKLVIDIQSTHHNPCKEASTFPCNGCIVDIDNYTLKLLTTN